MTQELPFGAQYRHQKRIEKWKRATRFFPKLRHDVWWFLHNVVSHPLLGVCPSTSTVWFHDYTSQKLNQRAELRASPMPEITDFLSWAKHNVVAHAVIGICPCELAFRWHDRTAQEMNVQDWV
jgi:hypothetical protein